MNLWLKMVGLVGAAEALIRHRCGIGGAWAEEKERWPWVLQREKGAEDGSGGFGRLSREEGRRALGGTAWIRGVLREGGHGEAERHSGTVTSSLEKRMWSPAGLDGLQQWLCHGHGDGGRTTARWRAQEGEEEERTAVEVRHGTVNVGNGRRTTISGEGGSRQRMAKAVEGKAAMAGAHGGSGMARGSSGMVGAWEEEAEAGTREAATMASPERRLARRWCGLQ